MNIITVARQIGSRGDWIAEQVAAQLQYDLVDRSLVEEICPNYGYVARRGRALRRKGRGTVSTFSSASTIPEVAPGTFPLSAAAYAPEFGLEFSYVREHDGAPTTYLDQGTYQLLITTLLQDFGQTVRAVDCGARQRDHSRRPSIGMPRKSGRARRRARRSKSCNRAT